MEGVEVFGDEGGEGGFAWAVLALVGSFVWPKCGIAGRGRDVFTGPRDAGDGYQEAFGGWCVLVFFCGRLWLGVGTLYGQMFICAHPRSSLLVCLLARPSRWLCRCWSDMVKWIEVGVNK